MWLWLRSLDLYRLVDKIWDLTQKKQIINLKLSIIVDMVLIGEIK